MTVAGCHKSRGKYIVTGGFSNMQEVYGKMMEILERIKAADSGKAEKLQNALRAVAAGIK